MAQEQGVILGPAIGVPRSRSDRPLIQRMPLAALDFARRKPLGAFGFFLIFLCVFAALFAPLVSRYDPERVFTKPNVGFDPVLFEQAQTDPLVRVRNADHPEKFTKTEVPLYLEGPSAAHWLGTDNHGYDIYARIVYGSQLSLFVGIFASVIATIAGTSLGVISGYFGGKVDMVIQRFTDALLTFPGLILLLLIVQVVDRPNKYWITMALGILGISQVIRIVRSSVLSTREEQYILAARSTGASDSRVMFRHILPNIVAPLIVVFTIAIGAYILAEAGLAFIGLGDAVAISWGKMVNEGRQFGSSSPLYALWVGLAITFSVLGFNLAGDALRDVLDPRLRGRGGRAGF
jgi:peptide/nickel transport system permease protein